MQFFKRRCSCGTRSPGQDISHECFKRNCGSNPMAKLNHLRAFARHFAPIDPPTIFSCSSSRASRVSAASSSDSRLSCAPSRVLFHLFTFAFVLAPFFSLASYHIVPLVPPLSLFSHACARAFSSPFSTTSLFFTSFFVVLPAILRHFLCSPLLSGHVTIPNSLCGGARTTSPPNNVVTDLAPRHSDGHL